MSRCNPLDESKNICVCTKHFIFSLHVAADGGTAGENAWHEGNDDASATEVSNLANLSAIVSRTSHTLSDYGLNITFISAFHLHPSPAIFPAYKR